MSKTKFCAGISDISDGYNAFIIDQWGVLHNGHKPYDGVTECLKELKERKKIIILLTNSDLKAEDNKKALKALDIGPSLYDYIVTAGELVHQGLSNQSEGVFRDIGRRCLLLGEQSDRNLLKSLDIEVTYDPAAADFLLITSCDKPEATHDEFDGILKQAARKRLKAICTNPDSRALIGSKFLMGPGLIAKRYQDFGGVVHFIGKPHKPIFQHCISILQSEDIYPGQTAVIGDTMPHDIIGGSLVEMDTCLVTGGLHSGAFRTAQNRADVDKALNILSAQYGNVRPTYLVQRLKWGNPLPDRKHKKRKIKS